MSLSSTITRVQYSQPWLAEVLTHRLLPDEKGAGRHFMVGGVKKVRWAGTGTEPEGS